MNDVNEQLALWGERGFIWAEAHFSGPELPEGRWEWRIYPANEPMPHNWETRGVRTEGPDRREVAIAALRMAAAKWPGVV